VLGLASIAILGEGAAAWCTLPEDRVKRNALLSRDPAVFVQPCWLTMALIQIGAKGDVQPFETG
jgi:hypothetical protein